MTIKLNQKERVALTFLKAFADSLLEGRTVEVRSTQVNELKKMGVKLEFLPSKNIRCLVRGKRIPFIYYDSSGAWHSSWHKFAVPSKRFLPFQVKKTN